MIIPTFDEWFDVMCDASMVVTGVVLLHNCKSIAFESCKFIPIYRNCIARKQELTTIVHAIQI